MNHTGHSAQQGEQDIHPEVQTETDGQKNSQRRQKDCQNDTYKIQEYGVE